MAYKREIKPGDKIRLTGELWRYSALEPGGVYTVRTAEQWGWSDDPDWDVSFEEHTEQDTWIITDDPDEDWGIELVE